jgi:NitT/TauT family transport system substrate-binding protein
MVRAVLSILVFLLSLPVYAAPLKISVSETILSLPFFVAQSEGFFRKHGVEVELSACKGGQQCLKNMLNGGSELSTVAELPVVLTSFDRSDFSILTTFVTATNNLKILARSSKKITESGQLRNLDVGYVKGGTSHYLLDMLLVYSGVDPKTVTLVPITADTALDALASGRVDAISIWEPYASRILLELKGEVSVVPTPKLYTETFNLVAMQSVIQDRPADLVKVIASLQESSDFIKSNPDKAQAMIADRFKLPLPVVRSLYDNYRFRLSLNGALPRTMEGQARWALREGHVGKKSGQPNFREFLFPAFLKKVDPAAVTIP